jgi:hypothetical protein
MGEIGLFNGSNLCTLLGSYLASLKVVLKKLEPDHLSFKQVLDAI